MKTQREALSLVCHHMPGCHYTKQGDVYKDILKKDNFTKFSLSPCAKHSASIDQPDNFQPETPTSLQTI